MSIEQKAYYYNTQFDLSAVIKMQYAEKMMRSLQWDIFKGKNLVLALDYIPVT